MLPTIGIKVLVERNTQEVNKGDARVLDIRDNLIFLDLPYGEFGNRVMIFHPNDKISVSYQLNDGAVYAFTTTVESGHLRIDNLPAISIRIPSQSMISRTQRREFLRVPVRTDVSYILVSKKMEPHKMITGEGYTWDISGGGLAFYTEQHNLISPGDPITFQFYLPGEQETLNFIKVKGVIVRLKDSNETNVLVFSVRFTELARGAEQRIIQYAFKRQIELKNKGIEYYK